MIAIICVELEYLFQNTKMYFWFYLWPLYHYIIYIKQIISSCTLPGTWMAKSFYILCTLKCCTCKITPNSSLWQSYPCIVQFTIFIQTSWYCDAISPIHELIIFTKFHNDWVKIVFRFLIIECKYFRAAPSTLKTL